VLIALERRAMTLQDLDALIPGGVAAVSAITISELLVGVHLANTDERRERRQSLIDTILSQTLLIPFDLDVARVHAELVARLRPAGVVIGAHDLQIAATALAGGHEVVTVNEREFGRVPGLRLRRLPLDG
jgi:tRNA(fMet)-specific endonuclease VapC